VKAFVYRQHGFLDEQECIGLFYVQNLLEFAVEFDALLGIKRAPVLFQELICPIVFEADGIGSFVLSL
jgi:hypothetical protein